MCDVEMDFKANYAPVVKIEEAEANESTDAPTGSTEWFKNFCAGYELKPFDAENENLSEDDLKVLCDKALRELVEAGAIWRYGEDGITEEIRARIDRELKILSDKLISAYFLIVWDFVNWARQRGIPSNARGSGVGTMVGYCLGLSNACPVHYGLLFERFTDPDRSEYPDIDIDICQDGRAECIDYVRKKYGHVAQIITFGTLKARAVLRDVGRVLDVPLPEVDRIAKLVPPDLGMTLPKALKAEPDLKKEYDTVPTTKRLIDLGMRLEGLTRHAGIHAAGVILATQPLDNIVPLYRDPKSGEALTQWDGPTCEKVGLLKMDFLGLRTLSIVERAKKLIKATMSRDDQIKAITGGFGKGPRPDTEREFGLDKSKIENRKSEISVDPSTSNASPSKTRTSSTSSAGAKPPACSNLNPKACARLLMGMKPDRLEDLIAANALYPSRGRWS